MTTKWCQNKNEHTVHNIWELTILEQYCPPGLRTVLAVVFKKRFNPYKKATLLVSFQLFRLICRFSRFPQSKRLVRSQFRLCVLFSSHRVFRFAQYMLKQLQEHCTINTARVGVAPATNFKSVDGVETWKSRFLKFYTIAGLNDSDSLHIYFSVFVLSMDFCTAALSSVQELHLL